MTDQEKQKLNERLAKWVGHWILKDEVGYRYNRLYLDFLDDSVIVRRQNIPFNGNELEWPTTFLPQFTDSLDACFKWLVPKTILRMMGELTYDRRSAVKALFKKWLDNNPNGTGNFAEALCLAIEELIDKAEIPQKG